MVVEEAEVLRELTPSERRKAEIAERVTSLTREIKAIREYGGVGSFTHDNLKWWKDNHPSLLIFNLGLSAEEIIGHVTAEETTPKWTAVAIVTGLTHLAGSTSLGTDSVDDYSRRYRKLIRHLDKTRAPLQEVAQ